MEIYKIPKIHNNYSETNKNYHKTRAQNFQDAKSHVMEDLLRRNSNRNKPQAIKEGAVVLALAHSDLLFSSDFVL